MRCLPAALMLAALSPCFGRELIYLNSGFSLEVESHSQENQTITCRTATGTLEFRLSDVARIELLPDPSGPRPSAPPKSIPPSQDELLSKAAMEQGLPPELIRSVAKIESGLKQDAISAKGAIGLMQLMPGTAVELGVEATRAEENALGGAKYLRELLLRYHCDSALALAAYNAGPGAVDKYRGVPPYAETRQYVLKVLREYERQHKLQASTSITH
ncbi:MAG TPA: lytic transglycosylase domain-containing protein [Bryobacteraceae bacterium]|jgi:soluble lytic murein transglycosylase-like protein|nr:lytic transglycosylase domain-containing protein [Bryobacteraceae bacterium]